MRGHRVAVVGLVVVAFAACGSDDLGDTTGSTSTSTTPTTTTTTPGSTSSLPPSTTAGGGDDDEIDSVQWGPDDPPIPGEYSAFAADGAAGLSCDSIDDRADGDPFWTLAADVCRVFTGAGSWPDVASVPAPPAEGNAYQRCLDGELFEMLERALDWRAAHPGASPLVRYPARGTHSPCQTTLYDVGPTEASTGDRCINDESLAVPAPGVPVVMSAPGITGFANPRATVDGSVLCVVGDSQDNALRTFIVVVPTTGEGETVSISVETNYGTLQTAVELPAVDTATTEPSVVTTGATTPTDSTSTTVTTAAASGTTESP